MNSKTKRKNFLIGFYIFFQNISNINQQFVNFVNSIPMQSELLISNNIISLYRQIIQHLKNT